MYNLKQKRQRVFVSTLAVVMVNSIITAAPSLSMEVEKNILMTFANVMMFIIVWDAYFDEQLSQKSPWGIIKDLLTITAVGTITTFITYKIVIKSITRLIIAWGSFGWIVGGAIAGTATAILGIIWALYCDDLYRNSVV